MNADLLINRAVRSVLVRHWIDLGRLSVRTTSGKVYIHGALMRLPGVADELTSTIVHAMFDEVDRIRGVRRTMITLDNWHRDGTDAWRRVGDEAGADKVGRQHGASVRSYDVSSSEKAEEATGG